MKRSPRASINRSAGILAVLFFTTLALTACSDVEWYLGHNNGEAITVGPEGGTITSNGVTMVIPAGALDTEQQIVIKDATGYPDDNGIIGTPVTIDPDVVFQKPVAITLHYTLPGGVNLLNASMATLEAGDWSPIPETVVNMSDSTVTATVLHLSTFTPFWYEPTHELQGYYFSAYLNNRTSFAEAGMDNTLYNTDGKTAAYGPEDTNTATWTPFGYTMRADGLLKSYYTLPSGEVIHEFGIANPEAKVHMYFQTSIVNSSTTILFGFEKPAADYLPSLAGSQYFVGGYQSSPLDIGPEVFADRISFETADAGHLTSAEGVSFPFTYVVEAGGKVTMTVTYSSGTSILSSRLNADASLVADGYDDTGSNTVGLVVGARLSSGKTNANLTGTYHTVLYQPDSADTRVSYRTMTFDGQGGGTFITYDEQLETQVATGTLTYAMNDDGTFTLNLAGLSEGFDEPSVLSADGNVFVNPDSFGTHHTYTIGVKENPPSIMLF